RCSMSFKRVCLVAVGCLIACDIRADDGKAPLKIGLLPEEKVETLLPRFEPVRARLEKALGRPVAVVYPTKESSSYEEFVKRFEGGQIQLALCGGLSFLQASGRTPTEALVMRKKDTKFRSYFISRSPKKLTSLEDLKGMTFTFGNRISTSGHLMPRFYLNESGL